MDFTGIIDGTFSLLSVHGLKSLASFGVPFFLYFLGGGTGGDDDLLLEKNKSLTQIQKAFMHIEDDNSQTNVSM